MTATTEVRAASEVRTLGRTGAAVEAVSLGGEGILRTVGRHAEAVPMIVEALRWQLHDLTEPEELDEIFGKRGAIEAIEQARADGRVRHVGITGHHDPASLVDAVRRYPVDSVLCAIQSRRPEASAIREHGGGVGTPPRCGSDRNEGHVGGPPARR